MIGVSYIYRVFRFVDFVRGREGGFQKVDFSERFPSGDFWGP